LLVIVYITLLREMYVLDRRITGVIIVWIEGREQDPKL